MYGRVGNYGVLCCLGLSFEFILVVGTTGKKKAK